MKKSLSPLRKGFTLIELLVVIGILAVLLAITLIAINPARQFAMANNTKRSNDVNAILNAIGQYMADNRGVLPAGIPTGTAAEIGNGTGQANICADLITTYIAALPVDPQLVNGTSAPGTPITACATGTWETNYSVVQSASDGRVTVTSMTPELSATIAVTR